MTLLGKLYAWAIPAWESESPVDHTWVTSYDNRINGYPTIDEVKGAHQFFWYCWGSFHATGGTPVDPDGALGQQAGDLSVAQCLVLPNVDSRTSLAARGTIFVYGVEGVCHQLANQVLYATRDGASHAPPLTVCNARGYLLSSFIYGTYGLSHISWAAKAASCTGAHLAARTARSGGLTMASDAPEPDEFEKRAAEVLADDPAKLSRLLHLRGEVQQFAARAWPGTSQPHAVALNARNQHLIDEAAKLLGPENFKRLFGVDPVAKVNLVDPHIAGSAAEIPPPKAR